MTGSEKLPTWDLTPIFSSFESEEYRAAKAKVSSLAAQALDFFEACTVAADGEDTAAWLKQALAINEELGILCETLSAYTYARFSTATRDPVAMAELNAVEELQLPAKKADVLFKNALAARKALVEKALVADSALAPYAYHLREELFFQSRQMSPELEDLAEDLGRSGADAWSRLQESVSSNASAVWDEATGARKTVIELRNLAFDPDRSLREKAFNLELSVWKSVEIPMAAALNGVKGTTNALNARRGWKDALEKSMAQARISPATLDALISAMESSLPMWRRYLKAKARALGLPALAFYDLFAPVEKKDQPLPTFSWDNARDFIRDKFSSFDPVMGAFAMKAFNSNWIDAQPREGKVGGAYCTDFPMAKTARVLCNFDGSFSSVSTVAHELGHAWHHECILDKPYALTQYPMTLAETASIFAETIVSESALAQASRAERLPLVEMHLQDGCQVIVDILSRFYFEKAVFGERLSNELGPDQFSALMLDAQARTYGEGLDPEKRHPYMWAVKGHYYIPSLSYYNFPYAFGQLFGLGLYERYKAEGSGFAQTYRQLLGHTGSASAVEVTRQAGFDIEKPDFWLSALSVFERQTAEFDALVTELAGK
ncbi:MAG: M3 family oligoendopeptidase [Rectinemataceae bacterium]|nr:M3 family oligoendopeptidase [Rectinemataceae bacterium]